MLALTVFRINELIENSLNLWGTILSPSATHVKHKTSAVSTNLGAKSQPKKPAVGKQGRATLQQVKILKTFIIF